MSLASGSSSALPPARAIFRLRQISSHFSPSTLPTPSSSSSSIPLSPLPVRHFSSTRSSNQSKPHFSFTTASSFRGKPGSPVYTPPGSSPAKAPIKEERSGLGRLKQGLPEDHPLCRWRDKQLEKSPKGAGHDWFFVEGVPGSTQGVKEEETEGDNVKVGGIKGVVLGVADGVGGWEESGVDPSHFSQALMWFARERVRNGSAFPLTKTTEGEEGVELSGKGLRELLEGAFRDVQEEKGIVAGSSTACLVALDSATGRLHAANLGDSSYLILRPVPSSSTQQPTPPSSPSSPPSELPSKPSAAPTYKVLHSEPSQTHFFNAPFQLSKLPPSSSPHSNSLMDLPSDAAITPSSGIQLQVGDVVVLCTDGQVDNVFPEELEQLAHLVHTKCLEEGGGKEGDEALLASSLSQTTLNFARLVMFKRDKVTPFEVEARRYGYGKGSGLGGGKIDDVTVVVAVVGEAGGRE